MLIGKYFDATISPMEMDQLEAIASGVDSGKLSCLDKGAIESLRLINAISRYAANSFDEFAGSLPQGLEDRLNVHISMLAAKDKSCHKRPWLRKATIYSAAAAVAGILAVAGYHLMPLPDNGHSPSTIMIANISQEENSGETNEDSVIAPTRKSLTPPQGIAKAGPAKSSQTKAISVSKIQRKNDISKDKTTITDTDITNSYAEKADEALSAIPPFTEDAFILSEEAFRVMPTGVTAYVETSQLLLQPISTLSQSINGIYESVEIMSEALSGVSTALEAVNSSLALLSDLELEY